MKKKILFAACIVICLSMLAYGTVAYFTAESVAHNVITTGGVDIQLVETTDDGEPFPEEGISGVLPGTTATKNVSVKNIGLSEAWIRVRIEPEFLNHDRLPLEIDGELPIALLGGSDKWELKDGYYYYTDPVAPGESTELVMEEVEFLKEMGNEYQMTVLNLRVFAEATQVANNGKTVFEAKGWPEI